MSVFEPESPTVFRLIAAKLRGQYSVIFPSALSVPVRHQRMEIMQSRIHAIAWLLAIGMPLWSLVDALAFSDDVWRSLLTGRLLAGAAFASFLLIGNALLRKTAGGFWMIHAQLAIIFAIPTLFYLYCHAPLNVSHDAARPFAEAVIFSYYLLPFIVLTGIGIFPLTLLESGCFAAPLLIAYMLTNAYYPGANASLSGIGAVWIMAVVAIISMLISLSQLRLLIDLITYAAYDPLTDCLSRRSGEKIIHTLWNHSVRRGAHIAIALIDLDHFKTVNDAYGHHVGDKVLANAAIAIKKAVRESDFVIRWGGEEFLIIMFDADISNASAVVARMSRAGYGLKPDDAPQTASVGLAERIDDDAKNPDALIAVADKRLYQAKQAGRNCCIGSKVVMLR